MPNSKIPHVLAYTGVGNPLKLYNDSSSGGIIYATMIGRNDSDSVSINITQDGVIMSFFVNLSMYSAGDLAGGGGTFTPTFTIKRNGATLWSNTLNIVPGYIALYGNSGTVVYETLSFLSGAEVKSTDIFTFEWSAVGSMGFQFFWDMQINALIKSVGTQLVL